MLLRWYCYYQLAWKARGKGNLRLADVLSCDVCCLLFDVPSFQFMRKLVMECTTGTAVWMSKPTKIRLDWYWRVNKKMLVFLQFTVTTVLNTVCTSRVQYGKFKQTSWRLLPVVDSILINSSAYTKTLWRKKAIGDDEYNSHYRCAATPNAHTLKLWGYLY